MSKSTTEQQQNSKDNSILEMLEQRALNEFLAEDDGGVTKRRRLLEVAYEKAKKQKALSKLEAAKEGAELLGLIAQ